MVDPAQAQDESAAAYERATSAIETGDITRARNLLRSIVEDGDYSEEVFLALGSAQYRLNDFGEATLAYRRAQYLSPRMVEAAQNLEVVEKKVGFLKFEYAGIDAFLAKFRQSELVWLISLGVWLAVISLAVVLLARRLSDWRPLFIVLSVVGLSLAISAAWAHSVHDDRLSLENRAIITGAGVEALVAPVPDAETVIALPPGTEVLRVVRRGPWDYVEIPGSIRGWIRSDAAKGIWPVES